MSPNASSMLYTTTDRRRDRSWLSVAFLFTFVLASCVSTPKSSILEMPEGDRIVHPDDSLFSHVLAHVVQDDGSVSFQALETDTELTEYLRQLALARPEIFSSRQQQLAFWLNAYNAYALDAIRSSWPVSSVDDISGFFRGKFAWIAGQPYSLNDISGEELTRNFREPRAFFGLYDGTVSAPHLAPKPFEESGLSDQLDNQIRRIIADSTKTHLDTKENTLSISSIFQEYREEIEKPAGSVIAFIRAFATPEIGQWIDAHPLLKLSYPSYDYSVFSHDIPSPHEPTRQPVRKPVQRNTGGIR